MSKSVEIPKDLISFKPYGAAGGLVTGSCYLLEIGPNSKIMVDAGLFQGRDEESENGINRNSNPATRSYARGVSQILVTHPHIDHIGGIPKYFKTGFTPTIMATEESAAFMESMLRNSADILKSSRGAEKLYSRHDVDKTIKHIKVVKAFKEIAVGQKGSGNTAEFLYNGHIMGSASIVVRNPDGKKSILFTGDMGKPVQTLCGGNKEYVDRYPQYPINTMVVEATNSEVEPVPFEEKRDNFLETIRKTWAEGGNPMILSLSLHRAQEIIEMLHNEQNIGHIPADCKIYIDAPFAMELTKIYEELGPNHMTKGYGNDPNFYKTDQSSMNRFSLKNVTVIESHQESLLNNDFLANYQGKAIIVASGGMAGYGRGVNYLTGNFCKNSKNAVLLTCYQVEGTEGADLLNKGRVNDKNEFGAKVYQINGFTSHISGSRETFDLLESYNLSQLENVIITHGRDSARKKMAEEFKSRGYSARVILPRIGEEIIL